MHGMLIMKRCVKMDEAADPTGEGGAGDGGTPPSATSTGGDQKPANPAPAAAGGDGKPYLGEPKSGDKDGAKDPKPGEQPKPATDEDYLKAFAKDEKLLGDDKSVTLDAELAKGVLPTARELGVSPETFNRLANALAKAQVDRAREAMKARVDYFEKMKQESMRTYTPKDFERINSAIDRWFKPGGTMNAVIRNSELGADPEFLALMHHLGKAVAEDGAAGAGEGGGSGGYDPNSIDGLAKAWK